MRARGAVGTAALGRHHAGRPVDGASRLARPAGRGGDARVHRADVPLRTLVHQERPCRRIRMGREGRREGDGGGAAPRRTRRAARIRPPVRHGGARADRHLRRRAAQGKQPGSQEARPVLADPRRAIGGRVPRDHPPPRHDADRLARFHGPAGRAFASSATASSSTTTPPRPGTPRTTSTAWPRPAPPSPIAPPCSRGAASR